MSLLDHEELLTIKLFYTYEKNKYGKVLKIFNDEEEEEILKSEQLKEGIEVIETGWRPLLWKDQNDIMKSSYDKNISSPEGSGMGTFNFFGYQDSIIKKALKTWNIKDDNNNPIPVNPANIDKLPSIVVSTLYQKIDKLIDYTEDEVKN
jgi:hypothetical protein